MKKGSFCFFVILTMVFQVAFAKEVKTILFLGDSLSSGYGVPEEKSFFYLIQKKLSLENPDLVLSNVSQPGSTSSTAYERLHFQLQRRHIDVLFLELGGNDALRGYSSKELEENLLKTIKEAKNKNLKVILVGLTLPPNYDKRSRLAYEQAYQKAAKKVDIYIPSLFLLLKDRKFFQADYIHPNEEGHKILAGFLLPYIKKSLQ